jgi:hypothetical protein
LISQIISPFWQAFSTTLVVLSYIGLKLDVHHLTQKPFRIYPRQNISYSESYCYCQQQQPSYHFLSLVLRLFFFSSSISIMGVYSLCPSSFETLKKSYNQGLEPRGGGCVYPLPYLFLLYQGHNTRPGSFLGRNSSTEIRGFPGLAWGILTWDKAFSEDT